MTTPDTSEKEVSEPNEETPVMEPTKELITQEMGILKTSDMTSNLEKQLMVTP